MNLFIFLLIFIMYSPLSSSLSQDPLPLDDLKVAVDEEENEPEMHDAMPELTAANWPELKSEMDRRLTYVFALYDAKIINLPNKFKNKAQHLLRTGIGGRGPDWMHEDFKTVTDFIAECERSGECFEQMRRIVAKKSFEQEFDAQVYRVLLKHLDGVDIYRFATLWIRKYGKPDFWDESYESLVMPCENADKSCRNHGWHKPFMPCDTQDVEGATLQDCFLKLNCLYDWIKIMRIQQILRRRYEKYMAALRDLQSQFTSWSQNQFESLLAPWDGISNPKDVIEMLTMILDAGETAIERVAERQKDRPSARRKRSCWCACFCGC